jgi:2-polyprenyl-6-methoxyphenol hydroxylase-like FAD-dependent oxidoreductase
MTNAYDIVTIGGGLAGASLARVMAEGGARVLVLERETRFKDRVRGEALFPWGAAELERLGLRRLMLSTCAIENRWWDDFLGPDQVGHRDTVTETPGRTATLTFYHPGTQETLLRFAAEAGAEVRRGVRATGMSPGRPPKVTFEQNSRAETIAARLIVGADGRDSIVRRWAGFASQQDPPRLRIAGVLFEGMTALPQDTTHMVINPELGQSSILIPQGSGRVRAYVIFPARGDRRLSGERDIPRFVEEATRTGVRPELFEGAHGAGPLATFEAAGAAGWNSRTEISSRSSATLRRRAIHHGDRDFLSRSATCACSAMHWSPTTPGKSQAVPMPRIMTAGTPQFTRLRTCSRPFFWRPGPRRMLAAHERYR